MSRYVVVRHGNTFEAGEPVRRIGARTDLPLTATGIAQANALGQHFAKRDFRFARALTSPLCRARVTAELILAAQPWHVAIDAADWLSEVDHGPDEGALETEVVARVGGAALAAWDEHGVAPPGWEVDADGRLTAWRSLFADLSAGDTLVVTSNGVARFAVLAVSNDPTPASLRLRTGAYGIIEQAPGGSMRMTGWDRRPSFA